MSTLTVFCPLGLSNRLRVLLSGLALAEASGRQFKMLWPITPACAAPFAELYVNPWPVETVTALSVADLPYISGWFGYLPDLLATNESILIIGHSSWLIRPKQFPWHDNLLARCQLLFAELQPTPFIQYGVDSFRQRYFRPTMVGVHLRRGDLLRQRPDTASNTAQAMAAVDDFLNMNPDAGILLCTDDGAVDPNTGRHLRGEDVQKTFQLRYGPRGVWTTPRSLDRRKPVAIQDALIDLYLLRMTDAFVGTKASSFSELVAFDRDMPYFLAAGATPGYKRIERLSRMTGLYAVLSKLSIRQTGKVLPFPALLHCYATAPFRWIRHLIRSLGSGNN